MKFGVILKKAKWAVLIVLPIALLVFLRSAMKHRNDLALFNECWNEQPNLGEMQQLINDGANVNYRDGSGLTSLHGAQDVKVCKLLLDNGANVNAADWEDGQTPLMIAAWNGNASVVRVLLKKGAKVNTKDGGGKTALSFTRVTMELPLISPPTGFQKRDHKSVVQMLRAAGAKE